MPKLVHTKRPFTIRDWLKNNALQKTNHFFGEKNRKWSWPDQGLNSRPSH